MVQTLSGGYDNLPYQDFVLNLNQSTTDIFILILALLYYCGFLGNAIFLLCSAWFLLDKTVSPKKKIFYLLADIWTMSVCILIPVMIVRKGNLGISWIVTSLFPTLYANNWYMTCYILLCLVYPFLNQIIHSLDQRGLLRVALLMGILYLGICFFRSAFFPSQIIVWIAVYFGMAYLKLYMTNITESKKYNLLILLLGLTANLAIVLITNFLGLKISLFKDKNLRWVSLYNPFSYMMAFGLLNLFRKLNFHSAVINGISRLSFLIYIFHDNLLIRNFYRSRLWHIVYQYFGHSYVIGWAFLMTIAIFVVSVAVCLVYEQTVQRLTHKVCDKIYFIPKRILKFVEEKIFKIS